MPVFFECFKSFVEGQAPTSHDWTLAQFTNQHAMFPYLCELVGGGDPADLIKPYFDFDLKSKSLTAPGAEELTAIYDFFEAEVRSLFSNLPPNARIVTAHREPAVVKGAMKMSFRVWILGALSTREDLSKISSAIPNFEHAPDRVRACFKNTDAPLFDISVYQKNRKLNLPTKQKEPTDLRVMIPMSDVPIEDYLATHFDPDWPRLTLDTTKVPPKTTAATQNKKPRAAPKNNKKDKGTGEAAGLPQGSAGDSDLPVQKRKKTPALPTVSTIANTLQNNLPGNERLLNQVISIPTDTCWSVEGTKLTPTNCLECLVNQDHMHSSTKHSSLYLNPNRSVKANCFSHGTRDLDSDDARHTHYACGLMYVKVSEDTSAYESLKDSLCEYAQVHGYRKLIAEDGLIYKPVTGAPYAYERFMEPNAFINFVFYNNLWLLNSNIQFGINLVRFLEKRVDQRIPEMTSVPSSAIVQKYFNMTFPETGEDTPLFDKILDLQFGPYLEVKRFLMMCFGRLFSIRDAWQFMLYLKGVPSSGKSTIINVIANMFTSHGVFSAGFENRFGLSGWYDKEVVIADDLPKNFADMLHPRTLQTMITMGRLRIKRKGRPPSDVKWDIGLLFGGNHDLAYKYDDQGQISRRLIEAVFTKVPLPEDIIPNLEERICREEIPALIKRFATTYRQYLLEHSNHAIHLFCPEHFLAARDETRRNTSPLYAFLAYYYELAPGSRMDYADIQAAYTAHKNLPPATRLEHATFMLVNPQYTVERLKNLCVYCLHPACKGCCPQYNRKRTNRIIVHNIRATAQME
ncbi:hypothetical protein M427DRAFT_50062 [Gonapodya prolifera JEL478]|uniref:SF3 helicase domain-containing protein n=1 Tax=Gonapodya prolifera (strain JEL478) TaxID=1344416 RepID=A0A138ZWZ4_GONPJ|nr:hypothetical protein M427DRAFT_50062 [Gonapodya prolifera JEL478]|eukprot:KXS09030.1 hypothetical protein M427DRAFT_50062 [Gonapodya prolifera JEL478]